MALIANAAQYKRRIITQVEAIKQTSVTYRNYKLQQTIANKHEDLLCKSNISIAIIPRENCVVSRLHAEFTAEETSMTSSLRLKAPPRAPGAWKLRRATEHTQFLHTQTADKLWRDTYAGIVYRRAL